jgi:transposase
LLFFWASGEWCNVFAGGLLPFAFLFFFYQVLMGLKPRPEGRLKKENMNRFDISGHLPEWKKSEETEWLSEVNSQSLQASLANLESAYTRFFREKKGFPKFKSKHHRQSFQVPQSGAVGADFVKIPKVGHPRNSIGRETPEFTPEEILV